MNKKQRISNRATSRRLKEDNRDAADLKLPPCTNCGRPGRHYYSLPRSIEDIVLEVPAVGYWLCEVRTDS